MSLLNIIAREGNFVWHSEAIDAGPYYVGWTLLQANIRGFGNRGLLSVRKPGGIGQKEAFRQSKAAFECCRHYAQVLCAGMRPEPEKAVQVIEVAAKVARAEYSRWSHQFGVYDGSLDGYLHAVLDRFEREIKKVVFAEVAQSA